MNELMRLLRIGGQFSRGVTGYGFRLRGQLALPGLCGGYSLAGMQAELTNPLHSGMNAKGLWRLDATVGWVACRLRLYIRDEGFPAPSGTDAGNEYYGGDRICPWHC